MGRQFFSIKFMLATFIIILVFLPLIPVPRLMLRVLILMLMYAVMAESWNIIGGYTGYASLANAAFFGLSGYVTSILLKNFGFNPFITVFLGGAIAVIVAFLIGYPLLTLKGNYFVLGTLATTLLFAEISIYFQEITGGARGLFGLYVSGLNPEIELFVFYWFYLGLMFTIAIIAYKVENSTIGITLAAIREDEVAAVHMGINAARIKTLVFMLSSFFFALAGGIYPAYLSYINPEIVFAVPITVFPMLMTLLGGSRTWLGPLIGAVILQAMTYLFSFLILSELNLLVLGLGLILVITILPEGVVGHLKKWGRATKCCSNVGV